MTPMLLTSGQRLLRVGSLYTSSPTLSPLALVRRPLSFQLLLQAQGHQIWSHHMLCGPGSSPLSSYGKTDVRDSSSTVCPV